MKVAIIHYWLTGMRGGEKVVESMCEMFPQADIFTHVYCPERISERINRHSIKTTFIANLPFARRLYQKYLPLMPLALEQLDLRDYDLVISSESGPAKGVITRPDALHVCYCHTPMRYMWNMYFEYLSNARGITRLTMPWLMHRLRVWDVQTAARVDLFVANSRNVAQQVRKYYGRSSVVIHPPIDVEAFSPADEPGPAYLCAGQLVRYKRIDLAIEAFNELQKPLTIIGEGQEYRALKRSAGATITFLGRQDFATLRCHYAQCRALIFPGEEDFGIVPVEVIASGRPVIAFCRGGALETMIPGKTGIFFDEQTPEALAAAVRRFEEIKDTFKPSKLVEHSRRYSKEKFKTEFAAAIDRATKKRSEDLIPANGGSEVGSVVPIQPHRHNDPRKSYETVSDKGRWRA